MIPSCLNIEFGTLIVRVMREIQHCLIPQLNPAMSMLGQIKTWFLTDIQLFKQ